MSIGKLFIAGGVLCFVVRTLEYTLVERHPEIITRTITREVKVPVTPTPPELEFVIQDAAQRHDIPELLIRAVIRQESGRRNAMNDAVRREPHLERRFGDVATTSSYGLMQVIPVFAKVCGLHSWSELVGVGNIQTNVDCGAKMLKSCMDRARGKTEKDKWRSALTCYNGSAAYPDLVFAKLIDVVAERRG